MTEIRKDDCLRGRIVRAKAGRDCDKPGALYAVTGEENGMLLLCDGKRRPLERPKRKNPRHIEWTDDRLPEEGMRTNRALRRELRLIETAVGGEAEN